MNLLSTNAGPWAIAVAFAAVAVVIRAASRRSWRVVLLGIPLGVAAWFGGIGSPVVIIGVVALAAVVVLERREDRSGVTLVVAGMAAWEAANGHTGTLAALGISVAGLWVVADRTQRGIVLAWTAAAAFVLVLSNSIPQPPGLPTRAREIVAEQAASRLVVPVAVLSWLGMSLWPVSGLQISAARSRTEASGWVAPLLALLTMAVLRRSDATPGLVVTTAGFVTMPIATMLCLAHSDLRAKLTAAFAAVAGFAVAAPLSAAATLPAVTVSASLSVAVAMGVVGRLEARYGSREAAAFRGLATRHPTASLLLTGAAFGMAASVLGPVSLGAELPAMARESHGLLWVVLLMAVALVVVLALTLAGVLFGPTRVPEFIGPVFERVGVSPAVRRSLAGPASTLAWSIGLLLVAAAIAGQFPR